MLLCPNSWQPLVILLSLSEKGFFFFFLLLKDHLAEYTILCRCFYFFQYFKYFAGMISEEKLDVILILAPL